MFPLGLHRGPCAGLSATPLLWEAAPFTSVTLHATCSALSLTLRSLITGVKPSGYGSDTVSFLFIVLVRGIHSASWICGFVFIFIKFGKCSVIS